MKGIESGWGLGPSIYYFKYSCKLRQQFQKTNLNPVFSSWLIELIQNPLLFAQH